MKTQFVYVTYINTSAEKVWDALIDNEMIKRYWGSHKNVSDWRVGSTWLHQDYDSGATHVEGKVVEVDPPKRLVVTWAPVNKVLPNEQPSLVSFEIEAALGVARLTVKHAELEAGSKMLEAVSEGWPKVLSSLKTLLETGQAIEISPDRYQRAQGAGTK